MLIITRRYRKVESREVYRVSRLRPLVRRARHHMQRSKGEATLGVRLKSYRRNSGLSQAEFARKLGLPQLAISMIEHGRRRPSATLLRRMADILKVRTDRLFLLSPPDVKLSAGAASRIFHVHGAAD